MVLKALMTCCTWLRLRLPASSLLRRSVMETLQLLAPSSGVSLVTWGRGRRRAERQWQQHTVLQWQWQQHTLLQWQWQQHTLLQCADALASHVLYAGKYAYVIINTFMPTSAAPW